MGCESSKQTFCSLNRQVVEQNSDIIFNYDNQLFNISESSLTEEQKQSIQNTLITTKEINNIINALNKIKNFGNAGTRNPTQAQMDALKEQMQYEGINATTYDAIVKILDSNSTLLHQYTPIKGTYLSQIREKINKYKLNDDRCNTCNTKCNAGCQVASQAPPCDTCNVSCNTACESYVCAEGSSCCKWECGGEMCARGAR